MDFQPWRFIRCDRHGASAARVGRPPNLVIEMVQRYVDTDPLSKAHTTYRGGCTLLINLEQELIRYAIRKRVGNVTRIAQMKAFAMSGSGDSSPYFLAHEYKEPFAMLHRGF